MEWLFGPKPLLETPDGEAVLDEYGLMYGDEPLTSVVPSKFGSPDGGDGLADPE